MKDFKNNNTTLRNSIFFLFASCFILIGCSSKNNYQFFDPCHGFSFKCVKGKQVILIDTSKGRMLFELDGDSAPVTVGNFLDLVSRGAYENTVFNRVVREPIPFVIQGGKPIYNNQKSSNLQLDLDNYFDKKTGSIRLIPLEIKLTNEQYPRYNHIINDPNLINKISLRHKKGSISMARSESLNSGSSQFYISLKNLPVLDGRYSVFGRLVKGHEVLKQIKKDEVIDKILHIKDD